MSEAIKWLGPPQYTDFGRVCAGDVIYFNKYPALTDLSLAATKWVEQGMAEWFSEEIVVAPAELPTAREVYRKRKIKEANNG
jgi:hypothetical protein